MILHAEQRQFFVAHTFVGVIVQVDVCDFNFPGRKRIGVHGKTVILRGDFHLFGKEILYRVIRAMVAELQLKGFATESETAELMAETNPKDRHLPDKLFDIFDRIAKRFRITRTVREKDAVRLEAKNFLGRSTCGHDPRFAVMVDEQPQDVLLDPVIESHNAVPMVFRLLPGLTHLLRPRRNRDFHRAFFPAIGFLTSHAAGELLPRHARQLFGFKNQLFRWRAIGGDYAAQRAYFADVAHQCARINVPNHRDFVTIQIELRALRRPPVRRNLREFPNDQRFDVGVPGLFILEIRADVADVRISQADNLARIAWIGENFLISGEAGIENDFAAAARDGAARAAVKDAPVFQRERRRSVRNFRQVILP